MILRLSFYFVTLLLLQATNGQVSWADISVAKTICCLTVDNCNIPKLKLQFKNKTILLNQVATKQPRAFSARLPSNSLQRNISGNSFSVYCREGLFGSKRFLFVKSWYWTGEHMKTYLIKPFILVDPYKHVFPQHVTEWKLKWIINLKNICISNFAPNSSAYFLIGGSYLWRRKRNRSNMYMVERCSTCKEVINYVLLKHRKLNQRIGALLC